MSRGFRDADQTQAMSEKAIASAIDRLLESDADGPRTAPDGRCVDCGVEIGEERRRALPSAVRCVTCQGSWESSHRR
jgi:phage/conjugal plasmid C-4 type zinc finger TraR family protein